MHKVSNKNTRKKCKICPEGNYSEKNVWGGIHGGEGIFREWIIVQRGTIYVRRVIGLGEFHRGQLSWREFQRGQLSGGSCPGKNYLGVIVWGHKSGG